MPGFLEAWEVLNPHHLIIGGDFNQLQSFAELEDARTIWSYSPIWYAQQLGCLCTLLDVQFRMQEHVYHPTSQVHYGGLIKTPSFLRGREYERGLSSKLSQIKIDPLGKGMWTQLGHNVLVLDLQNGKQSRYGTTSWANPIEARIVTDLMRAINRAGVPWADMMVLSPYEGQYQVYLEKQKSLGATDLAVRKIDSSQGSEKPVVVFSSTKTGIIGFLASSQRQNVATSRQQSMMIVVGSLECLLEDKTWGLWWDALRQANRGFANFTFQVNHNCRFELADGYAIGPLPTPASTVMEKPLRPTAPLARPATIPQRSAIPSKVAALDSNIQESFMAKIDAVAHPVVQKSIDSWGQFAQARNSGQSTASPVPTRSAGVGGLLTTLAPRASRNVASTQLSPLSTLPAPTPLTSNPPASRASGTLSPAPAPASVSVLPAVDTAPAMRTPYDTRIQDLYRNKGTWSEDQKSAADILADALREDVENHLEAALTTMETMSKEQIATVRSIVKLEDTRELYMMRGRDDDKGLITWVIKGLRYTRSTRDLVDLS